MLEQIVLLVVLLGVFIGLFRLSGTLVKRFGPNTSRRCAHIVSGTLCLALPSFLNRGSLVILSLLVAGILFLGEHRNWWPGLTAVARPGPSYFPLGVAAAALFSWPAYMFSVAVLAFADPAASWAGGRLHKKDKSFLGSIAFFSVALLVAVVFSIFGYPCLIILAAPLTFVEYASGKGWDNFTLPLIGAISAQLLFQFC